MRCPTLLTGMALLVGSLTTLAQADEAQDALYDLATIEAEHEICGFPLSDEQQDVIVQRRDALVSRGTVSENDVTAMRDQVTTALKRQRDSGLCRSDGAEARLYKHRLVEQGLP